MNIVVFGLTISSSWGNGHATIWRGLCRALGARGHRVTFFERDVPYYAAHRDATMTSGCDLRLYPAWEDVIGSAREAVANADVAMVTSYCPDAQAASKLVLGSSVAVKVFYDLDTPVTLDRLARGERVDYIPEGGLGPFDLVLSFTGGGALDALRHQLGASVVAPLYGSVDPDTHRPVAPDPDRLFDLSYLGTFAADRQVALDRLLIEPARRRPGRRFAIAGSMYPVDFPWTPNIYYLRHMPPPDHPAFFCSSGWTLNITRGPMAEMGFCPSGRLFEAAACATPVVSDTWDGLETFFEPGREILIARGPEDVLRALDLPEEERARIGHAARERALAEHTADTRARQLEEILSGIGAPAGDVGLTAVGMRMRDAGCAMRDARCGTRDPGSGIRIED
jgi:spore maturation protein CgeB